jgi:hypothetical protein
MDYNLQQLQEDLENTLKNSEDTSQLEESIQNLISVLSKTEMLDEIALESLEQRLFEDFYISLMQELFSVIEEQDEKNLINAKQTGLSDIQLLEMHLKLYRERKGREIEEYASELYERIAETVLSELQILQQSMQDVENLSSDEVAILESMIKEGKTTEVLEKLDSFNNKTTVANEDKSQYAEIIQLLKTGDLEKARDEINRVIYSK